MLPYRLNTLFKLGRIKFLSYSPLLYGLGAIIATFRSDHFDAKLFFLGQFAVWITHLMTHYYNEYYDFDTDSLNTHASPWTGGSRVLPNGELQPRTSFQLAILTTVIALGLSLLMPSLLARVICWLSIALGWGYSAPPLALSRRGLGEFTTVAVLNVLTPLLGFVLQNGHASAELSGIIGWVLVPLALIEYVRMMVMNMPDRDCDAQVGKDTLIVRIGMPTAVRVHALGMLLAYLALLLVARYSATPPVVIGMLLASAPLGLWNTLNVNRHWQNERRFFMVPFWASTHNAFAAWLALAGFVVSHPLERLLEPATHVKAFAIYLYPAIFVYLHLTRPRGAQAKPVASSPSIAGRQLDLR